MKTPSVSQQWCQQVLEQKRVAAEVRAEAAAANAEDKKRLSALDAEIANLENRAAKCDETAIAMLPVKRDLRPRLAAKLTADAEKRFAEAMDDNRIPAVTAASSFSKIIEEAEVALVESISPFCRDWFKAEQIAKQTDSGAIIGRYRYLLANNISIPEAEWNAVVKSVANEQNPPWKFS